MKDTAACVETMTYLVDIVGESRPNQLSEDQMAAIASVLGPHPADRFDPLHVRRRLRQEKLLHDLCQLHLAPQRDGFDGGLLEVVPLDRDAGLVGEHLDHGHDAGRLGLGRDQELRTLAQKALVASRWVGSVSGGGAGIVTSFAVRSKSTLPCRQGDTILPTALYVPL